MAPGVGKSYHTMGMMMNDSALAQKYENKLNHNNDDEVKGEIAALPMMVRTMTAMSDGASSI